MQVPGSKPLTRALLEACKSLEANTDAKHGVMDALDTHIARWVYDHSEATKAEHTPKLPDERDSKELAYDGPNKRWVNVKLDPERDSHLTPYRLLQKMRSAIRDQLATITKNPKCTGEPFWVSIEVVGGFTDNEAVHGAAEQIVLSWMRRVHAEGLPFDHRAVFRKIHSDKSILH
ncbi:uncharacterized protein N7482_008243 [Penicillium canariense]|uniref:Uncharacterized protein n=1 Tax=Penicillium canariense TaxID=189055 RepID=A0A9W9HUW3_9EURO|nr:uncharacterized protein N7482_008243 [Penicillium canariense]KAJ5157143.1 hypothetical protein N7482_008243 [Penicillium canariense]